MKEKDYFPGGSGTDGSEVDFWAENVLEDSSSVGVPVSRAEETWVGFAFFQVVSEESEFFLSCDEEPSFLIDGVRSCDARRE